VYMIYSLLLVLRCISV